MKKIKMKAINRPREYHHPIIKPIKIIEKTLIIGAPKAIGAIYKPRSME